MAAGGLGHFFLPFLGASLHLCWGDIFHMLRHAPMMTEGISQFAEAIAPELILQRHGHLATRGYRLVESRVHIVGVDE